MILLTTQVRIPVSLWVLYKLRYPSNLAVLVFHAYMIITKETATVYVNSSRFESDVATHLNEVEVKSYDIFFQELKRLSNSGTRNERKENYTTCVLSQGFDGMCFSVKGLVWAAERCSEAVVEMIPNDKVRSTSLPVYIQPTVFLANHEEKGHTSSFYMSGLGEAINHTCRKSKGYQEPDGASRDAVNLCSRVITFELTISSLQLVPHS